MKDLLLSFMKDTSYFGLFMLLIVLKNLKYQR
jgi:hypothetical protein